MKITILNGNPDSQNAAFDDYVASLMTSLTQEKHEVNVLTLREMDLKFCTGCFGCWVKTPGQCVVQDASHQIGRAIINSDFLLWAAPLRMGFPSALLKMSLDRCMAVKIKRGSDSRCNALDRNRFTIQFIALILKMMHNLPRCCGYIPGLQ